MSTSSKNKHKPELLIPSPLIAPGEGCWIRAGVETDREGGKPGGLLFDGSRERAAWDEYQDATDWSRL